MEFAVNYSPMLAGLVSAGQVQVDRFKCPAWPDLLREAQATRPVYVHFPLVIGEGHGMPIDEERKQHADLDFYAGVLESTGTPLLNTHLHPTAAAYSFPLHSLDAAHARLLVDGALRDLEPLIRRFGAERVIVENVVPDASHPHLLAAPEVLQRILEETGCGFLFDISHARLAAVQLGLEARAYIAMLPLDKIRELHVTGIQRFEGHWVDLLRGVKDPIWNLERMTGRMIDHLPMTETDWTFYRWAMGCIRDGEWGRPWVAAYEYGGVGGFWNILCDSQVYLRDLPALRAEI